MQYTILGNSDLRVSKICLGTMTWGEQNSEAEAHQQLDYAVDCGINFIDAAELYPVPPMAETQGRTESYLGSWLAKANNRQRVVVATKVAGPSQFEWLRGGVRPRLNHSNIRSAIQSSLQRLQCDYVDLYQLHWPERATNYFGTLNYRHVEQKDAIPLEESLTALQELVDEGLVRHIGLSNETPWGLMECLRLHTKGLPRVQSMQNPYSLLNRSYEVGMAEISIREQCGLLAYSALGFGVLTGKYLHNSHPPKGRITRWPEHFSRYLGSRAQRATEQYVALAEQQGITPTAMALAFVAQQSFVTSCIIGATTLQQLEENIKATELTLSDEIIEEIDAIESQSPYPSP